MLSSINHRMQVRLDWTSVGLGLLTIALAAPLLWVLLGQTDAVVLVCIVGPALLWIGFVSSVRVAAVMAVALNLTAVVLVPFSVIPDAGPVKYTGVMTGAFGLLVWGRSRWAGSPVAWRGLALALLAYAPATLVAATGDARSDFDTRILATTALIVIPSTSLASSFDVVQRRWLARAIAAGALLESIYAFMEFVNRRTPLWFSYATDQHYGVPAGTRIGIYNNITNDGSPRAQATMAHPLLLGLLAAVALVMLLAYRPIKSRVLTVALAGCFVATFYVAGDRTFFVIVPLVLLLFPLRAGQRYTQTRLFGSMITLTSVALVLGLAGFFSSATVLHLLGSNSVSHRSQMIGSASFFLHHAPLGVDAFGAGYLSSEKLFTEGWLPLNNNLAVVDNAFISTLAMAGIVGFILLIVVTWNAARSADAPARALLAVVVATFFSFDVPLWPSSALLFGIVIGLCYGPPAAHTSGLTLDAKPDRSVV